MDEAKKDQALHQRASDSFLKRLGLATGGEITTSQILDQLLSSSKISEDDVRQAYNEIKATDSSTRSSLADLRNPAKDERFVNKDSVSKDVPSTQSVNLQSDDEVRRRHVALHLYYDGEKYSGLAENVGRTDDHSIERALFAALRKTHLINYVDQSERIRQLVQYSRCGRTDRGVSAAGQVLALKLKSAVSPSASWDMEGNDLVGDEQLPKNSVNTIRVFCPQRKKRNKNNKKMKAKTASGNNMDGQNEMNVDVTRSERVLSELAYDKILNNVLPPEIRILGWTPVSSDFSARFSATTRTYRYFFQRHSTLDLSRIQSALSLLEGEHDFRNFCKMDVEHVYNFVRKIHYAQIYVMQNNREVLVTEGILKEGGNETCFFEIHGQAFLWHQIRCIVSILFLVGQGLEEPSIVSDLLDIEKYPGKPSYNLADERHLVLHHCGFPNLQMGYSVANLWSLTCHFEQQCDQLLLAASRIRNCINLLQESNVFVQDVRNFCHSRLTDRRKKCAKGGTRNADAIVNAEMAFQLPLKSEAVSVKWKEAIEWMKTFNLIPGSNSVRDFVHIPLRKRAMGTTYEEKIASTQQSSKRKSKYEENVVKKRKSKEDDQAFYDHMTSQGGSAF